MSEIVFVVEQAPEGGFTARTLGHSIFTEADNVVQLRARAPAKPCAAISTRARHRS